MASGFIREKIKERPINKRRLLKRLITTVVMAVVFGVVASLTYIFILDELSIPDNSAQAEIIRISEYDDMLLSDHAAISEDSLLTALSDNEAEDQQAAVALVDEEPRTVINNITNQITITPEKYEQLYEELQEVVRETERSLVTVTGSKSNTDWFENTFENRSQGTGIILADNNRELLILTSKYLLSGADTVSVAEGAG